jgi:hypothetical protein
VCVYVWYWGLNSGSIPWATPPVLFCDGFFKIGSCELFAWAGWLQTLILLSLPPE